MAVVIPITGFLIRRIPHARRCTALAMGLFSAGTLLAALAPGFAVLLAARVVQASGTAIMMPLLMTTVMTLVPPQRRGAVMGNISIVISVAPAIGPAVSGCRAQLVLAGGSCSGWSCRSRSSRWWSAAADGRRRRARRTCAIDALSVVAVGLRVRRPRLRPEQLRRSGSGCRRLPTLGAVRRRRASVLARSSRASSMLQRTDRALLDLRTFRSRTLHHRVGADDADDGHAARRDHPAADLHADGAAASRRSTTGLLLLPGGLVMGLLGPLVGRLYDRFGARALLVPGTVVTSLALWSTTLFDVAEPGDPAAGASTCCCRRPRVRVHPAVHRRVWARCEPQLLLLRQRDLRHHPAAGRRGRRGAAGQHRPRARLGWPLTGAVPRGGRRRRDARRVPRGGVPVVVGIVGAFFVRTPDTSEGAPAGH